MAGLKETKEMMVMGFALAAMLKGELKDGFQVADLMAILEKGLTPEFMAMVKMAVEGMGEIPAEAKDLDLFEGLELVKFCIGEIKKLAV